MNPFLLLEAAQTPGGESPYFVLLVGVLGIVAVAWTVLQKIGGDR